MMVPDHGKSFSYDIIRPEFGAKKQQKHHFRAQLCLFAGKYKSYITLRVYTGVSKGAAFIYSGLKSYKVFVT